jgi:hypothetical protein
MEIHSKRFTRNFLKFSLIGLIFILSCGKTEEQVGIQDGESVEWYEKLGFKENMKQMKEDTMLMTRRLGEGDWADAEELCIKIEKTFNALNLASDDIPKEFFEIKGMFNDSLVKMLQVCREKDHDKATDHLDRFKKTCSYCHRLTRKEWDRMNLETDFDVAMDKYYKGKELGDN